MRRERSSVCRQRGAEAVNEADREGVAGDSPSRSRIQRPPREYPPSLDEELCSCLVHS